MALSGGHRRVTAAFRRGVAFVDVSELWKLEQISLSRMGTAVMERDEIREVLRSIFEDETGETLASLPDDVVLAEDFDLDSVDMVGLIMQVERHFRVRLTYDDLVDVTTAGALINLVQAKVAASATPKGDVAAA